MPADDIGSGTLSMDQSAAPLFPASHDHELDLIQIRKFFVIHGNDLSQLAVFIALIIGELMQVDGGEKVGDVQVVRHRCKLMENGEWKVERGAS